MQLMLSENVYAEKSFANVYRLTCANTIVHAEAAQGKNRIFTSLAEQTFIHRTQFFLIPIPLLCSNVSLACSAVFEVFRAG